VKVPATVVAIALTGFSIGVRGQQSDAAHTFLAASFNCSPAELTRLKDGQVIARTLDAGDRREVATVGVMRARISPEFYAGRVADIATFKKVDDILQIGVFGSPPALRDVATLTLEASDLESLQKCRVGDCGVQLSATAIDRFRTQVDWSRQDAGTQANGVMRQILVEYVTRYLASGGRASMEYADQTRTIDLGREFVSLAETGDKGLKQFPGLHRHLLDYPARKAADTLDSIYWSKEKVGRRPVVSVTHLSIQRTSDESVADYAIASKHIYGTHYFDASLGLTILLRDRTSSTPATYVVYINRSRVDVLSGLLGGLGRKIISGRARSLVSDQLTRMQHTLEQQFAESQPH
jgi:hypothetical protein